MKPRWAPCLERGCCIGGPVRILDPSLAWSCQLFRWCRLCRRDQLASSPQSRDLAPKRDPR